MMAIRPAAFQALISIRQFIFRNEAIRRWRYRATILCLTAATTGLIAAILTINGARLQATYILRKRSLMLHFIWRQLIHIMPLLSRIKRKEAAASARRSSARLSSFRLPAEAPIVGVIPPATYISIRITCLWRHIDKRRSQEESFSKPIVALSPFTKPAPFLGKNIAHLSNCDVICYHHYKATSANLYNMGREGFQRRCRDSDET